MNYVVTIAESDRGNYHIALDQEPLSPLCGTKPRQRATSVWMEKYDPIKSFYCSRCYYLQLTDGKWDGR